MKDPSVRSEAAPRAAAPARSDLGLILKAAQFAAHKHRAQRRKDALLCAAEAVRHHTGNEV